MNRLILLLFAVLLAGPAWAQQRPAAPETRPAPKADPRAVLRAMEEAFSAVADDATAFGRAHDIHVIDGGCPLMFDPVADGGHKLIRFVCTLTGAAPRHCE